jgi:DNA-binding CsgD family transcriptional regulator/PAS domain-containing protein
MATDQARIVSEIYDAAVEPNLWPTALASVAAAFGAAGAAYLVIDKQADRPRLVTITGPQAELHSDYMSHYGVIDPYRRALAAAPSGSWSWVTRSFSPEQLRGDEWYNDFMLRSGVRDALGAHLFDDERHVAVFGLHRGLQQPPLDGTSAPHLRPLLEALGKAAALHCRLDRVGWTSAVALQALDRVAAAVIVVDQSGRLINCNAAAERTLRSDDGLGMRGGVLVPRRAFEALKLARLIALATAKDGPSTGHMLIGRSSGHASYVVTVAPLSPALAPGERPLAMVLVADPDERAPSQKDLAEFFGFSPAEGRLAAALMEGRKLDQIAADFGVRITTLRTQLSSILKKAGVERQADLIRVLSAVCLIEADPDR